jgi:endo-1,4-beta-xylanase
MFIRGVKQRFFYNKFRMLMLLLLLISLIYFSSTIAIAFSESLSLNEKIANIESRIRHLRTGDLIIRVVNEKDEPITGAAVNLEQIKHNFEFGTALSTEVFTNKYSATDKEKYLNTAKKLFNASVPENSLKWYSTESERGKLSYVDNDNILQWSLNNGMKMRGHTLFWEKETHNQPWVKSLSKTELKKAIEKRTKEVCLRYKGRIHEYDVLNEILHGDFFEKKLGPNIIKEMFLLCKQVDPNARLYLNEYFSKPNDLNRYVQLIRDLLKQGVPIGGIGFQGHIRGKVNAVEMQVILDTLGQFGLPIKITEFDVLSDTEQDKVEVFRDVYRVAFAHPATKGILMWGFWAGAHWEPKAALFTKDWQPLPIAKAYQDLVYNQWWTRVNTLTNEAGEIKVRAFFGEYFLKVNAGNQVSQMRVLFAPGDSGNFVKVVMVNG